jgi:uncharacterized protein (DUF305 family)
MKNMRGNHRPGSPSGHYAKLAAMAALSFLAMYALMYAMVDEFENVRNNVNQVYMAALMTMPMVVIELLLMRSMYADRRLNWTIGVVAVVAACGFWLAIRQQAGVAEAQFLRSMIPHHGGAILMCRGAKLTDPEVLDLCERIVVSQKSEIAEMEAKLSQLED